MAIQQVDTSLPAGDTNKTAYTKINQNFTNTAHAASRIVGTATNQIPLAQDALQAAFSNSPNYISSPTSANNNVDKFEAGSWNTLTGAASTDFTGAPYGYFPQILTLKGHSNSLIQFAFPYITDTSKPDTTTLYWRSRRGGGGSSNEWSPWRQFSESLISYTTTTAAGANVVVDANGKLMRSTSSERYKDIIGDLTLDDEAYNNAMALAPIIYRSTADADNPLHHYYSFSAEALGAFDKAFTFWRFTEQVEDEDGNITEQPLAEPIAEGININALLAFSHAIAIKQHKMISKQQAKIDDLESRLKIIETSLKPAK